MDMLFDEGGRGGGGGRGGRGDHHPRVMTPDFARFFVAITITFLVALVMFVM